jgi:hypothetical protein
MDQFEQAISESAFAVGVLGNIEAEDYELIPLGKGAFECPEENAERKARALCFVGVFTLGQSGQIRTALACPLSDDIGFRLSRAFCLLVAERFAGVVPSVIPKTGTTDAGADWLKRLHSLPDLREN